MGERRVLRQIGSAEWDATADFLDGGTWLLRWLVAFLRRGPAPEDAAEAGWDLWAVTSEEAAGPVELHAVLAFSYPSRTLYVHGGPEVDPGGIHDLCRETLGPRKLVGDGGLLREWERAVPALSEVALRRSEVTVLAFEGAQEHPQGFREALPADAPLVGELLRQLRSEIQDDGEEIDPRLLVEHRLVYVLEEDARVQGMILSNLSDGRYVHAGSVFVHPAYRGRGVGRRLAAGLGGRVREDLGATVVLDVYQDNRIALAAYTAAGYRPVGEGLAIWVDGEAWEGASG